MHVSLFFLKNMLQQLVSWTVSRHLSVRSILVSGAAALFTGGVRDLFTVQGFFILLGVWLLYLVLLWAHKRFQEANEFLADRIVPFFLFGAGLLALLSLALAEFKPHMYEELKKDATDWIPERKEAQ